MNEANAAMASSATPITRAADRLNPVRTTGRNLWLAGLGAVGTIADLDRESRGLFDRLVERGRPLSYRQKQAAQEIGERAESKVREMRERVRHNVKQVLTRVGVPTREDFSLLAVRLEALSQKIDEIAQSGNA